MATGDNHNRIAVRLVAAAFVWQHMYTDMGQWKAFNFAEFLRHFMWSYHTLDTFALILFWRKPFES